LEGGCSSVTLQPIIADITRSSQIHLRAGGGGGDSEKWYALQDLQVEDVRKEMVFLGETVLQVRVTDNC
jgi:hypothetical protein